VLERVLPWLVAAALIGCGGRTGDTNTGGGAEGEGEGGAAPDRLDTDVYVDDSGSLDVNHDNIVTIQVVASEAGRAKVWIFPDTLEEDEEVHVSSMELKDFSDTRAIIDGVYDFEPVEVRLLRPVQILLPTNGLPLWEPEQVELVRWPLSGIGWEKGPPVTAVNEQHASAFVEQLGIYGLRVVGGFSALPDEVPTEGPVVGNCPADGVARGSAVGQVMRDPKLKDADGNARDLYDLCGSKAIVVVSAGMW